MVSTPRGQPGGSKNDGVNQVNNVGIKLIAFSTTASSGKRVALVERDKIGRTCLNYGCDPTKTMLKIGNLLYRAHHVDQFGIDILDAKVGGMRLWYGFTR